MNTKFLYNNNSAIFVSARRAYDIDGIQLIVAEGHIFAGAYGCVARCKDDEEAIKILTEAGYVRWPSEINIIFKPGLPEDGE